MLQSKSIARTLTAALAVAALVGCTQPAPPPPAAPQHDAATSGPELAGAWYQVYFDTNSAAVNERGQMIAKNVAYVVTNNDATRVTVIGRTDRVGAAPANMALSQRRANAVRDALIAAGVPAGRIDTSWTGEASPASAASPAAVEAHNRVVDVTVVKPPL
jgi:OOP family OmpA-OmpF porin